MGQVLKKHNEELEVQTEQCLHCGLRIPRNVKLKKNQDYRFCCSGCEHVYGLIHELGLKNFYQLKNSDLSPQSEDDLRKNNLDTFGTFYEKHKQRLIFHVEGIQCSACVWLIKKVAKKYDLKVNINTVASSINIINQAPDFEKTKDFLKTIQSLGYNIAFEERPTNNNKTLLIRLGVCTLLAINIMGLNFAIYTGLNKEDGILYAFVQALIMGFATVSFFVGGSYFFKKTFRAIKSKVFHFDIPITLGIVLSFFGSWTAFLLGYEEKTYFDSMSVFIALMLLGRFLQERWLERSRASILNSVNFKGLKILKLLPNNTLDTIDFSDVKNGDKLVLRSGDIVPTESKVIDPDLLEFDYQWISGESEAVHQSKGDVVYAGARYIGIQMVHLESLEDFESSRLKTLSSTIGQSEYGGEISSLDFSKYYTVFVLVLLAISFSYNIINNSFEQAFLSAVTISVITCPCAIGITLPIVQFILQQKLFNKGVYIQNGNTLSAIAKITAIVFDKTGTLTFLNKEISKSLSYHQLSNEEKTVLFSAVAQSKHPFSQQIFNSMLEEELTLLDIKVTEKIGEGLFFTFQGQNYYLGKDKTSTEPSVVFMKNQKKCCDFRFNEVLLKDSESVLRDLKKTNKLYLLSGDKKAAVLKIAKKLHINEENVRYECLPHEKLAWVKQTLNQEKTLYLGDGLNDLEAMQAAYISGASLSQSLVAASSASFSFKPFSLLWLKDFFECGKIWKKLVYFNYSLALVYNVLVAWLATIGWIGPLEAAIIMPAFSIAVLVISSKQIKKT
ncbi:MAG TPA: heavy metal translocating P-type ATPase metal-binding domain-containing protein [Oligoflexia bacterium]|nr:heavy metal translocating P-type ATPase metal-binding domain-containing protein [Oligoflexia bacterium]HMR24249.1 heavy metal translocating P-type ATPase metal-binding domain-containing protein [Oligoflexia bacterium]